MFKYVPNIAGSFLALSVMASTAIASENVGLQDSDQRASYLNHADLKGAFCLIHKDIEYDAIDLMTESTRKALVLPNGDKAVFTVCAELESQPDAEGLAINLPALPQRHL